MGLMRLFCYNACMNHIFSLIEKGNIVDYMPERPEIITTVISRVFLFSQNKKALKVYKRDSSYWNENFFDLSGGEYRRKFIREDFEWNHFFNPEVYLRLCEMNVTGAGVELRNAGESDELAIEMKLIDSSYFLLSLLASEDCSLDNDDFFSIGQQFAVTKDGFGQKPGIDKNWFEIFGERIIDVVVWVGAVSSFTPEVISELKGYLEAYAEKNRKRFESLGKNEMVVSIDVHGENAMYRDGKLSLIDICLPKEIWRLAPKELDIMRIGIDIFVLRGKEAFRSYLSGVKSRVSFDFIDVPMYFVYLSAVMSCYEFTLSQGDPNKKIVAEKYFAFFQEHLASAKQSL